MNELLTASHLTVVDAHVHFHGCFVPSAFFEAARANLERAASACRPGVPWTGVLCFAEGAGEDGFGRLEGLADAKTADVATSRREWRISRTAERESLEVASEEATLIVISGYQIQTREGLELLTLGTRRRQADGQPLEHVLAQAARDGAIPVVPWGFGKWTGRRRRIVRGLVESDPSPRLFLGDSANRPVFLGRSRLFDDAERRGVSDLPGSDPLPFPREQAKVGRGGLILGGAPDPEAPAADLKERIQSHHPARRYLRREWPFKFLRNQVAMQRRKRVAPPSPGAG